MIRNTILLAAALIAVTRLPAQWIKTNGPLGITINKYLNKGNLLFAGTDAKGIYKSSDNGIKWVQSNTSLTQNLDILSLASDDIYLYAGSLEQGMLRSPDDGVTWESSGLPGKAISSLIVANGFVFAGTIGTGIFRSADHGTTWQDINQSLLTSSFIFAMVYQDHRLIIEGDNYLFFSTDDGDSWDIDQGNTSFYVIDNFFHHGDTLLASAGSNVFRSTNGGVSWGNVMQLDKELVGFDAMNDTIYAGYKNGVLRSVDWGQSWTDISSPDLRYGTRFQNDFIISGRNLLMGFEEIGCYLSGDKGVSWGQAALSDFSPSASIDDAMINVNGTIFTGTHSDGVYKTSDNGFSWKKTGTEVDSDTLSNGIIFSMFYDGASVLLAGACGDGLYRSVNNGITWTHITSGLPNDVATGNTCIKSFAKSGPNIIAALFDGVFYSNDGGLNWHASTISGPTMLFESAGLAVHNNIVCVGIIALTGSGIYRSTNNGQTFSLAQNLFDIEMMKEGGGQHMYAGSLFDAYRSDDDGLSWNAIGPGIPSGSGAYTIMAWDNNVFIGNDNGLFFSDDFGASFTNRSQGMNPYPNNAVQGLTRDGVFVYAGMFKDGVWRRPLSDFITIVPLSMGPLKATYDGKAGRLSWQTFTESNLNYFQVERSTNAVDFNALGMVTAAGNSNYTLNYRYDDVQPGKGIDYYRLKMVDADGKFRYSNTASIKVGANGIMTIFPNPFTSEVNLSIDADESCEVKLRLVDAGGRLVKTQQSLVSVGNNTITMNGLDELNKGVYFLEVNTGAERKLYKLVK